MYNKYILLYFNFIIMSNLNHRESSSEVLLPFTWIDISPTIEGANAYLCVPSHFSDKTIKIQINSPMNWVRPTSAEITLKNGWYTLEELLTEDENQKIFDEWKANIASQIEKEKSELTMKFEKEFDGVKSMATSQWYDINNHSHMLEYFNALVLKFDSKVVYPWEYDVFIIHEPIQRFFEQYGLNYMKAIREKESPHNVVSQSQESVGKILNSNKS